MMRKGLLMMSGLVLATAANAGFTTIGGSGEPGIQSNFNAVYGSVSGFDVDGTFTAGDYEFKRVQDFVGGNLLDTGSLLDMSTFSHGTYDPTSPGTVTDQLWTDGTTDFAGRVRIAGFSQNFGIDFNADTDGTSPTLDNPPGTILSINTNPGIFPVGGAGPTGTYDFALGDVWAWAREGGARGPHNSYAADNTGTGSPADNMITWSFRNTLTNQMGFLVAFDDDGANVDRDYNDFWVEIAIVPSPSAVLLGMVGLGALAGVTRRFR